MAVKIAIRVLIFGRVQGVFFRTSAKRLAKQFGLTGWIKNLDNGQVEAVFEGSPKTMEKMIAWCRHGPPLAQVTDLQTSPYPIKNYSDFEIK